MAYAPPHSDRHAEIPEVVTSRDDEAAVDAEIAAMARGMRRQLRVPAGSVWAVLLSILGHSALALAISASEPRPVMLPEPAPFAPGRSLHLDWSLYAGEDSGVASLELGGDDEAPALPDQEEVVEVAEIVPPPVRTRREAREVVEEAPVAELSAAPVEALVDSGAKTEITVPTGEAVAAAYQGGDADGEATDAPATTIGAGGIGRGGGGTGPNRAEGGIGDGHGVDIAGVRRGHVARLNRAIRQKNPCTRELSHFGLSGNVVVGLIQAADGSVGEVRVLRSSGDARIDSVAEAFILAQQRLPAPDAALVGDVWQVGLRFQCGS